MRSSSDGQVFMSFFLLINIDTVVYLWYKVQSKK